MSLIAVVHLAERLLNQTAEQPRDSGGRPAKTTKSSGEGAGVIGEDQFTPSGAAAPQTKSAGA